MVKTTSPNDNMLYQLNTTFDNDKKVLNIEIISFKNIVKNILFLIEKLDVII
ncbi:hypothetical protein [Mycoplasmopsis arginini]|uniref:hypothetical protein n=1 Tax=Mycoplasmopsis arginini TaxID=2094 RepID=UPI0013EB289D|nr:hypothetical protein [Mycoplasmopsis arginini]